MQNKTEIPVPVVRRLSYYLLYVQEQKEVSEQWLSSENLADALGLTSSTVRQDLSYLDFSGKARRGYQTTALASALSRTLKVDRERRVIIVGAGNFGRALALHGEFTKNGFQTCAIVDSDNRLHGRKVGRLVVGTMAELEKTVATQRADTGVIAVPPDAAQEVSDRLVAVGVRGLLNLTSTHIQVAQGIAVVNVRLTASFLQLSCAMEKARGRGANTSAA